MSICLYESPNIQTEAAYIAFFFGKKMNDLKWMNDWQNDLNDPEFFDVVKTFQFHPQSRTFWNCNKNEYCFSYGWYFTGKKASTKSVYWNKDEKQELSTWENTLLK